MPNGSISALGNSGNVSAFHKYGKAFLPALIYFFIKKFSELVKKTSVMVLIDSDKVADISDSNIILCLAADLMNGVTEIDINKYPITKKIIK